MDFNKGIMFRLVGDFEKAITLSGKSFNEIAQMVSTSHPEMLYSPHDWDQLSKESQSDIIGRIKKTINALSS